MVATDSPSSASTTSCCAALQVGDDDLAHGRVVVDDEHPGHAVSVPPRGPKCRSQRLRIDDALAAGSCGMAVS